MLHTIFTGIFLDDESKSSVKQQFDAISETPEYEHFFCKHITLNHRPEFEEILYADSAPLVECYLTELVQDPYIQTFKVFVPFPHKKKLTHLTYAIANDDDHSRFGGKKRPIARPFYSNHLLKHLKDVERGNTQMTPNDIVVRPLPVPLKVLGVVSVVRSNSPNYGGCGPLRYT